MRTWLKLAGLAAVGLAASTAIAADHLDGPAVQANSAADINDLYAWMENDNVVLIMTVEPLAAPGTQFSDAVDYVFHVGAHPALGAGAAKTTEIICYFDAAQEITCQLPDNTILVQGDASAAAGLDGGNGVKAYAGMRKDPFFFYLDGFNATRQAVLDAAAANALPVPTPSGCFPLDTNTSGALVSALTGNFGMNEIDNFANANAMAIVLEVDPSILTEAGNETISVWASTHTK